jgi:CheY-like chemotaxis protein
MKTETDGRTQPDEGEEQSHAGSRTLRVLVVDDEALIGHVTASMLEDMGHEAQWVPTATEALGLLKRDAGFDLLITDHGMPEMTGGALAEAVHAMHPALPIVLATGFADVPDSYADSLPRLAKPYGPDELAAILSVVQPPAGLR